MRIEDELFKKVELSFDKLTQYGFIKKENRYVFSKRIMEGFLAQIEISFDQQITGTILDLSLEEEYTAFRIEKLKGEFVNTIREKYKLLLEDIILHCGKKFFFNSSQGNRIANRIIEEFHNAPEFLWEGYPDTGIFRHPSNRKWYALLTTIEKKKLDKAFSGLVEILNVKIHPVDLEDYLKITGIYPAYHMNKKSWISIVLDETFQDEEILSLIKKSRMLTS